MKVVLIDYDCGNISSVLNALKNIGVKAVLSSDHNEIKSADRVIFPGVGHAKYAMMNLKKNKLASLIPQLEQPLLGICLGMQLLCMQSEEENTECLGLFPQKIKLFTEPNKIPHIGWNNVQFDENSIFKELNDQYFYFVHSYFVPEGDYAVGRTDYFGGFTTVIKKDNFFGCQFHPEKSGDVGLRFLEIFINQNA